MKTERARPEPTVLDVLENALGERGDQVNWKNLSRGQLDNLRERLTEFSKSLAMIEAPESSYLLAGRFSRYWEEPLLRRELGEALLYYPRLVVMDPFADFFADTSVLPTMRPMRYEQNGREIMRIASGAELWATGDSVGRYDDDTLGYANRMSLITKHLYEVEGPLRGGVLVLRNQWEVMRNHRQNLETSVRADVRSVTMQTEVRNLIQEGAQLPVWDHLRGLRMTGPGSLRASDARWEYQHFFFHLAKTLALADAARAIYAPSLDTDFRLLSAKLNATPDRGIPPQVLREVSRIVMPSVEVAVREAVAIRSSSSNFADWRAAIRRFTRDSAVGSSEHLGERADDTFGPLVRRVERELVNRKSKATKDTVTELVTVGAISTIATAATSDNVSLGLGVGATAAVASGVVGWLRRAYRRPTLDGAEAVLATMMRSKVRS